MNIFKTTVLLLALTLLLIWIGSLIGGRDGMFAAFIFAVIMNFISYWFSTPPPLSSLLASLSSQNRRRKARILRSL